MRKWAVSGTSGNLTNTRKSVLGLTSGTSTLPELYQFNIGSSATPADAALQWILQRYTAAGTATSVTPKPLHPSWASISSLCSAGESHSSEPTYTSAEVMFEISLHQRSSLLWQAMPDCEIVLPAASANGVGMGALSGSFTSTADACFHFRD